MKIMISLLLTLSLLGCSSQPTQPSFYSDYEKEQIEYLVKNGWYFDSDLISTDNLTYTLDETGLLVNFSQDDFPHHLYATLTISDGQIFNLYFMFSEETPEIGNMDDPNKNPIVFTQPLHRDILNTLKGQWNQLSLFRTEILDFRDKFHTIFLGPAFYTFYKSSRYINSSFIPKWTFDINDEIPLLFPEFVVFSSKVQLEALPEPLNYEKLQNTIAFIYYTNQRIDSNSTLDDELLIQSILTVLPDYHCEYVTRCYSHFTNERLFAYQGVEWSAQLLTVDFFNESIQTLLDPSYSYVPNETKLLESGIVQSVEELYFTGYHWFGDGPQVEADAYLVGDFEIDKNLIQFEILLYQTYYDYEVDKLTLVTSDQYIFLPDEITEEFIITNTDQYTRWKITLQENESDFFYTIISAIKIKEWS